MVKTIGYLGQNKDWQNKVEGAIGGMFEFRVFSTEELNPLVAREIALWFVEYDQHVTFVVPGVQLAIVSEEKFDQINPLNLKQLIPEPLLSPWVGKMCRQLYPNTMKHENFREFFRFSADWPVQLCNADGRYFSTRIKDISQKGFSCQDPLGHFTRGEVYEFEIGIQGGFAGLSQVCWEDRQDHSGFKFLDLPTEGFKGLYWSLLHDLSAVTQKDGFQPKPALG